MQWVTDPESGKKSVTLTLLVFGVLLASFKLVLSDITVLGVHSSAFTGSDFALVLGAVAGLYGWRKQQKRKGDVDKLEQLGEGVMSGGKINQDQTR